MARLPVVGGDLDNWGLILNTFLLIIHNADGTLKDDVVGADQISDADLANIKTKLDIFTATEAVADIGDLSGVTDAAAARANLSVYSQAQTYTQVEVAAAFLALAGGVLTGKLTLDGDPTNALHAATKQYVDGIGLASIRDKARNLTVISNVALPLTKIDITADELMLQDVSGSPKLLQAVSETVDITANGDANGLDTLPGTPKAVSTWYYIWIIAKADGTQAGLLSASSTAPTMPSGYTYKALVGTVRNNASSNFLAFTQLNNKVTFDANQLVKEGSFTADSWTGLSVAAFFPPTAKKISCHVGVDADAGATFYGAIGLSPRSDGHSGEYSFGAGETNGFTFGGIMVNREYMATLSIRYVSTIYYFVDLPASTLYATGWEY